MARESPVPLLGGIVWVLATASVGTWLVLLAPIRRAPILPCEPRRPVPWHGVGTLLPIVLVAFTVFAAMRGDDSAEDAASASTSDLIERITQGSMQQTAFVVAFLAVVIAVSGATRADLGLPEGVIQFVRDVRIGIITWLASLVPVYVVQVLLISYFGTAEGHPLIQMIEQHANPLLFALVFAAAVVVAPICEELAFRLLLQGWLEKCEDRTLGWRDEKPNDEALPSDETLPNDEALITNDEHPVTDDSTFDIRHSSFPTDQPPSTRLGGLPYGWLPIVLSSLLFALAHVGYGPDPVPLFLFALMLGYVYQRTHRIVPSMVAHALFNGTSLFALWRVMS